MAKVRPQIDEALEAAIKRLHKRQRGYPATNFQEALGTVVQLAQDCLDSSPGGAYTDDTPFEYEISHIDDKADVEIYAKSDGPIEMTDSVLTTDAPYVVTPTAKIRTGSLLTDIEELDGVITANARDDHIILRLSLDDEMEIESLVDRVFSALFDGIHEQETAVDRCERAIMKYATPREVDTDD
jgi:hypothetical protein